MKLELARSAGFCYGVRRAVELAEQAAAQGAPCVYTHGQKEMLACEENLRRGIYLNDKTLEEITALCRELGLPPETYLIPVPQEAPEG